MGDLLVAPLVFPAARLMPVLPIPQGNVLPALAISLLTLGVLERDGVWVLAGSAVAGATVCVVSGVVFAMVKAGVYFFAQAVS